MKTLRNLHLTLLIFFAALSAAFLFALPSTDSAHASSSVLSAEISFTYDGASRTVSPKLTGYGNNASFSWVKDGKEVSTSKTLTVTHVSDGGKYVFTATENGVSSSYETFINITPITLSVKWFTRPYVGAPEYVGSAGFTYNGLLQGVYPRPQNAVSGDDVYFTYIGNTARGAGSYLARITGIEGENASDYSLPHSTVFAYVINKARLSVVLPDEKIFYGDELPSPDNATIIGFAEGDDESVLKNKGYVSDYTAGKPTGEYSLGYFIESDDYEATVVNSTLTVSPRSIRVAFSDSESFYGDEAVFSYAISGVSPLVPAPQISVTLPSLHAGVYKIDALSVSCSDDNYTLIVEDAFHEILPRKIEFSFSSSPITYGHAPKYSISLVSGSYAYDEDENTLLAEFSSLPASVGVFPVTARATSPDYSAPAASGECKILPCPITVSVGAAVSVYGDPFVSPSFASDSVFPFDETLSDVGFSVVKESGRDAGVYALSGEWTNPCYDVTVIPSSYTVMPRSLFITSSLVLYENHVLDEGGSLSFDYSVSGFVGADEEEVEIVYCKLNSRGTTEKEVKIITENGDYVPRARIIDPSGNYEPFFTLQGKKFTVYPTAVSSENSPVTVKLESGFTPEITLTSYVLDHSVFVQKYEKTTDFQSIIGAYGVVVENSADAVMEIRIPVEDVNRNYTVAVEKADGSTFYLPCSVIDGNAVFVTSVANATFILWQDDDGAPYALSALILFIIMIIELAVLFSVVNRYKNSKNAAFIVLSTTSVFGFRSSVYVFFVLTVVEGAICFALLVAILAVIARTNRLKKRI